MDLVLKLREIRRLRGLSQKDVAKLSGVGEKTISSFETTCVVTAGVIRSSRFSRNIERVRQTFLACFRRRVARMRRSMRTSRSEQGRKHRAS